MALGMNVRRLDEERPTADGPGALVHRPHRASSSVVRHCLCCCILHSVLRATAFAGPVLASLCPAFFFVCSLHSVL